METKHKIVLIDDDTLILAFLEAYLADQFELESFTSVEAFAEALTQLGKVGAIVSDLNLGSLSGMDVVEIARANQATAKTPIVMLSAENKSQARIDCLRLGADDFLTKPFNPEELQVKLEKIIELKTA